MGGSLAISWDRLGLFSLENMLDKSTKDATLMIRKWFHEALRQEKQPVPVRARLGAMTPGELASLQAALSAKPDMTIRHVDLLQVNFSTCSDRISPRFMLACLYTLLIQLFIPILSRSVGQIFVTFVG